eukprot:356780-Chlamydomonas_euryale.AAC.6
MRAHSPADCVPSVGDLARGGVCKWGCWPEGGCASEGGGTVSKRSEADRHISIEWSGSDRLLSGDREVSHLESNLRKRSGEGGEEVGGSVPLLKNKADSAAAQRLCLRTRHTTGQHSASAEGQGTQRGSTAPSLKNTTRQHSALARTRTQRSGDYT